MNVVTQRPLLNFAAEHADAGGALERWYRAARKATWTNLADVRATLPHADPVTVASGRTVVVFNIGGNKYRLVTAIHYDRQRLFVLRVMTHKEYERGSWKDSL